MVYRSSHRSNAGQNIGRRRPGSQQLQQEWATCPRCQKSDTAAAIEAGRDTGCRVAAAMAMRAATAAA